MINTSIIKNLITLHNTDKETLDIIQDCLHSFEQYHSAIYEMETKMRIYSYESMDADEYKTMVEEMDRRRTRMHNSVLASVNILNRLAESQNLAPVYDGTVSEEKPHRREVANAVLAYVEEAIKNRR